MLDKIYAGCKNFMRRCVVYIFLIVYFASEESPNPTTPSPTPSSNDDYVTGDIDDDYYENAGVQCLTNWMLLSICLAFHLSP